MTTERSPQAAAEAAECWLSELEGALRSRDASRIARLFVGDAYWRDLVAFTWNLKYVEGSDAIAQRFLDTDAEVQAQEFVVAPDRTAPQWVTRGEEVVEVFYDFTTRYGHGTGLVRLLPDDTAPTGFRGWVLLTTLQHLHGYEKLPVGVRREGLGFDRTDTRTTWIDRRSNSAAFEDREPEVLVVGGGQAGVMTAARLNDFGVDSLVVDRHARVGDNWRKRYDSLALHTKTDVVHFPYMAFPTSFPTYLPKDKFANWFEHYVEALEVNYWTSTEFLTGIYDELEARWTVTVRRDGAERILRPRHLVMATGADGGAPHIPKLPGLDTFSGEVMHTSQYRSGAAYQGKKVLVIGVGTSAHDVSYDLTNHGAEVVMLQRGSTTVINLETANLPYTMFVDGTPLEECDFISAANFTFPLQQKNLQKLTKVTNERDRETLDGLRRVGMKLDDGEDHTGYVMKIHRYGGNYYINVGCSELLIDGTIGLVQSDDVERWVPQGVRMNDGTVREFDVVVLATGYENQQTRMREYFGPELADRVGKIGGFDEDMEYSNMYKPTAQKGLWFIGGGIPPARSYSRYLAVQLQAALQGVLPGYREEGPTSGEALTDTANGDRVAVG